MKGKFYKHVCISLLRSTYPILFLTLIPVTSAMAETVPNSYLSINQQQKKITGTVQDQKGDPIIGANVVVKGTTNGTITDVNGQFSLDVPENAILQISYIGYRTSTIQIGNQTDLSIKLNECPQVANQ